MSRIRSIHPALFTDDGFMELSMPARLLLIGVWCESDDAGAFEWKPKVLKARVFPGDNVDAEPLLAELVAQSFIQPYEVDGRRYGAVRNFCRFQRPRKPKARYPLPEKFRTYVASDASSSADPDDDDGDVQKKSEPVRTTTEQVPKRSEIASQMEDGDGGGIGEGPDSSAPLRNQQKPRGRAPDLEALGGRLLAAAGWRHDQIPDGMKALSPILRLIEAGCDLDLDILPTVHRLAGREKARPKTWSYFDEAIIEARDTRLRPVPEAGQVVPGQGPPRPRSRADDDMERQRAILARIEAAAAEGDAA